MNKTKKQQEDIIEKWLNQKYRAYNVSPQTIKSYRNAMNQLLKYHGKIPRKETEIEEWMNHLQSQNKSPGTIQHRLQVVKKFYDWWSRTKNNPAKEPAQRYRRIRENQSKGRGAIQQIYLSEEQLREINKDLANQPSDLEDLKQNIKHKDTDSAFMSIFVLSKTGMRVGEAHRLTEEHIDLENKAITPPPTQGTTARPKAIGGLPIDDELTEALKTYLEHNETLRYRKDQSYNAYVHWMNEHTQAIGKKHGIQPDNPKSSKEKLTPHRLRHSLNQYLSQQGWNDNFKNIYFGWERGGTGEKIYMQGSREQDLRPRYEQHIWKLFESKEKQKQP